jgi:hypothetical protein
MEEILWLHRFTGGTKAYLNCSDSDLTVCGVGRHAQIVWLWIDNNGHRFGFADLDGMAATILYHEKQMELDSRGH